MNENVSNVSTFDEWMPNIYYVDISEYSAVTEDAIANNKYGVYISTGEGIHAYHGKSPIDYRLCKHLGVRVVELNYDGGIIIGSANDLSIIIVFPASLNMTHSIMINKIRAECWSGHGFSLRWLFKYFNFPDENSSHFSFFLTRN